MHVIQCIFGVFKDILYNADVFLEYFCDVLDNFSFEVYTKFKKYLGKHNTVCVVV